MNKIYIYILLFLSIIYVSKSEFGTIDTVIFYQKGYLEEPTASEEYFPDNIFGIPSRTAAKTVPTSSLEEVEPIGMGGEIIVGFKNKILRNGKGADFTIFENAFINPATNTIFAEPGIVSVSQDGISYYQFPFNVETLQGFAGVNYTNGKKDPFDPAVSGGDSFDLDDLGLDYIRYIKIKDTTEFIKSLPESSIYWSPEFILTGFDLDAVVGLYLEEDIVSVNEKDIDDFSINNKNNVLNIYSKNNDDFYLKIYDLLSNQIYSSNSNFVHFDISNLPKGLYFLDIYYNGSHIVEKIIND